MARIASKAVTETGVDFAFTGGHTLSTNITELTEKMRDQLAVHGLSQKIGDSYSGAESIEEAIAAAEGVWKNLKAGLWAVRVSRGGILVDALARATGKPFEECLAKVGDMDDKAKKALKKHPAIMQAMAEIAKEKADALAEASDAGSDLSELF